MIQYNKKALRELRYNEKPIYSFVVKSPEVYSNIDWATVESFGEEWSKFSEFSDDEIKIAGDEYFDIISKRMLTEDSIVLDVGCGAGRWSKYLDGKVKFVEAIDPSEAVYPAMGLLKNSNCRVTQASVDDIPFDDDSFDFVFSLGVLHHIPDTADALKKCVQKLKKGGHFMVYLYYNMDNRNRLYKLFFSISNSIRLIVHKMGSGGKKTVCDLIATLVYLPLAKFAWITMKLGLKKIARLLPLYNYHDKTFRLMRNDALDRFGTPLEQRFTREEITQMMRDAGLSDITFSSREPFWHAVGTKGG
ncbi:MAG: methyltransferase domain-containing protein [Cyclobacteriaceae bacterium]